MTNSLHPPAALRLRVLHSQGKVPTVRSVFPMKLPGSSISATASRHQHLCHSVPASNSATAPLPATPPQRPCQQQLCHGVPASNKPHSAEKSTPVWLAIWRIWAGFANSQLRCADFRCIYLYTGAHSHCCHLEAAAQT